MVGPATMGLTTRRSMITPTAAVSTASRPSRRWRLLIPLLARDTASIWRHMPTRPMATALAQVWRADGTAVESRCLLCSIGGAYKQGARRC